MALARAAAAAGLCGSAAAHGVMSRPPTWGSKGAPETAPYWSSCAGYGCLWFSQGCSIGCAECTGVSDFNVSLCGSEKEATITDPKHRTYNVDAPANGPDDWTRFNPWRAPGSAPVYDPCGMAGGGQKPGDPGNGGVAPPGHRVGDRGSELAPLSVRTEWAPGSVVDVYWAIDANHGGGYQYRLCPKSEPLTESCFMRAPLAFVGDTQTIHMRNGTDYAIPATYISEGTLPAGSAWARNPIPACGDTNEGGAQKTPCTFPQFPPPVGGSTWGPDAYNLWGFGPGACESGLPGTGCTAEEQRNYELPYEIVDRVQVPADLPLGDYVIGFRWDCEQTPQVWSSCGDVTITRDPAPPPTPPPAGSTFTCQGIPYAGGVCVPASFGYPLALCGTICGPGSTPPATPPPGPGPAPPPICGPAGTLPQCDPCCAGACVPCKQCVGQPKSAFCAGCLPNSVCADCYTVDPAQGAACMYDDQDGCLPCWAGSPPGTPAPRPPATPAPPTPATPAPPAPATPVPPPPATPAPGAGTPAPAPAACPGGSLTACMALCPPSPPDLYTACVADCGRRCL